MGYAGLVPLSVFRNAGLDDLLDQSVFIRGKKDLGGLSPLALEDARAHRAG